MSGKFHELLRKSIHLYPPKGITFHKVTKHLVLKKVSWECSCYADDVSVHILANNDILQCFLFSFSEGMRRNHVKVSSEHNIELVMAQWF